MQRLEISGAVRHTHTHTHIYIYVVRRQKVNHVTGKCGLDICCSGQPPLAGSSKNGNKSAESIKGEEYVEWLKKYYVLKDCILCTGVPPYLRVTRSKTYRGYVKLLIIPNAIYNVISV
jgi:hypothetical protein